MLVITVTYEQLKSIRDVFGPKYRVFYVQENGFWLCAGMAEGFGFSLHHTSDTKPATFDTDFPSAMQVVSL